MIQGTSEKVIDQEINRAPSTFDMKTDLKPGFADFFLDLHRTFTPRQQHLAQQRRIVLNKAHQGILPDYLDDNTDAHGAWGIELPKWCADQRNQMTGPADDAALVVKMLNSGAPGVMIDIEDSMANRWENLQFGIDNAVKAIHGDLTYYDAKRESEVSIKDSETVIWTRVRGLHLNQGGIVDDGLVSASVFDVARIAYEIDITKLKHNLCFYIPKSESAEEGLFWRDLFRRSKASLVGNTAI